MMAHRLRLSGLTPIAACPPPRSLARSIRHGFSLLAALGLLLAAARASAQPPTLAPLTEVSLDASAASLQPLTTPPADPTSASDGGGAVPSTVDEAAAQDATPEAGAPAGTVAAAAGEVIEYYALDAVGSVRVVFDTAGAVVARADYMPFGETLEQTAGLPAERFTSQERDPELGHDYFGARYYAARLGRFTTVDPVFGDAVENPQRWNRYAYALNSPLVFVDPDGLDPQCWMSGTGVTCTDGTTVTPNPWPGGTSPWPGYTGFGCTPWAITMCPGFIDYISRPPLPPLTSNPTPPPTAGPNPPTPPKPPTNPNPPPTPPTGPVEPTVPEPACGPGRANCVPFSLHPGQVPFYVSTSDAEKAWRMQQQFVIAYAVGLAAPELSGPLFARRIGLLNSNRFVRVGWGWKGTRQAGTDVFRIAIGSNRGPVHTHIDLWPPRAWQIWNLFK